MTYLAATLHTLGIQLETKADRARRRRREAGAITIEYILWAIFGVAIVGIAAAAITTYVRNKVAEIK